MAVTNILLDMLKSGQPVFYDLRTAIRAALASGVSERDILSMVTVTASELDTNGNGGNGHDLPVFTDLPDGLIDLPTAADRYGHSRQLLWQWVTQGRLPERGLLRRPGSTVANIVVAEADLVEQCEPTSVASDDDLPMYDELPPGLIDLPSAAKEYGCKVSRFHGWVKRGHLRVRGRLRAPQGTGYSLVLESELVHRLKTVDAKGGRSRTVIHA